MTGAAAGAVFGAFVVFVDSFGVERVRRGVPEHLARC